MKPKEVKINIPEGFRLIFYVAENEGIFSLYDAGVNDSLTEFDYMQAVSSVNFWFAKHLSKNIKGISIEDGLKDIYINSLKQSNNFKCNYEKYEN